MPGLLSSMLMGPEQRLLRRPQAPAAPMAQQAGGGGLLSMINPNIGQNPLYQRFDQNRDVLANMFLGGVGAESPLERMRGMAGGAMQGRETSRLLGMEREKQEAEQQRINATMQAFQKAGRTDLMQAVQGGYPMKDAWRDFMTPAGSDGPASVQEWNHFNNLSKEDQARYLRMKRANPYLDVGTGFVQPDPTEPGQVAGGPIIKENYQERFDQAQGQAEGKAAGDAAATYRSMVSKMPGLEGVVVELDQLADRATYTIGGQIMDTGRRQLGMEPTDAALARAEYIAIVDNQILPLLRDTFGAQFTEREGETLKRTLGDADKSPKEKQAVLKAFIQQKRRDVEALAQQAGQNPPPAPATGNRTSSGVQWSID